METNVSWHRSIKVDVYVYFMYNESLVLGQVIFLGLSVGWHKGAYIVFIFILTYIKYKFNNILYK